MKEGWAPWDSSEKQSRSKRRMDDTVDELKSTKQDSYTTWDKWGKATGSGPVEAQDENGKVESVTDLAGSGRWPAWGGRGWGWEGVGEAAKALPPTPPVHVITAVPSAASVGYSGSAALSTGAAVKKGQSDWYNGTSTRSASGSLTAFSPGFGNVGKAKRGPKADAPSAEKAPEKEKKSLPLQSLLAYSPAKAAGSGPGEDLFDESVPEKRGRRGRNRERR